MVIVMGYGMISTMLHTRASTPDPRFFVSLFRNGKKAELSAMIVIMTPR